MRNQLIVLAFIAVIGVGPTLSMAATPATPAAKPVPTDAIESAPTDHIYPLVLAAGALAGVITVNWLSYGIGNIPLYVGMETTAPTVSPAAAAASRIFVITSGVLGAWIADALYK